MNFMSTHLLSLILFVGVALALALFNLSGYSWRDWAPAYCQPDHCFCEALRDGPVVREYVFAGLPSYMIPGSTMRNPPGNGSARYA